ncbi:MAG: hypothetical protein ERJ68_04595 [Aphanocapsa feldmannii 277cI]|uniref:J domain-containing protein n=1 Tax=Aphanocapsa feldmannii 277cI TaxID=2507554 RepID=A0A524RTR2_9CHRO|nr:MAG: hypothetical protein ERJ68_04595 [Aphanocapsa feldmannii 277cI]
MTVTGTNPWEVLGLSPDADAESLKQAFRHLARQWHPDLNGNDPDAEERFKRINEAYAVLSDPRRRLAWERGTSSSAAGGIQGFPAFEDYLEHLFGAGRHSAASHRGVAGRKPSPPAVPTIGRRIRTTCTGPLPTAVLPGAGTLPLDPSPPARPRRHRCRAARTRKPLST